jgi:ATP-dependent Lon protease
MENFSNKQADGLTTEIMPIIPTMDVVVFPHMIVPLLVIDEKIIEGINQALSGSKLIMLLASKKASNIDDEDDAIGTDDLYDIGTIANIMRMVEMPEGGVKVLVQGVCKARALQIYTKNNLLTAKVEKIKLLETTEKLTPYINNIKELAERIVSSGQNFSPDFHIILSKLETAEKVADFVLSHLNLNVDQAQNLLEKESQVELLNEVYQLLCNEIEVTEIQEKIRNDARDAMNKSQKEYYLREQLKAIKKELGEDDAEEIDSMRQKLAKLNLPEESHKEVERQINRLERMASDSMEATVTRNYLEWVFALPWNTSTEDNLDLKHAQAILDSDHYGLKDVKDRILDYMSVRNLKKDGTVPILCFVGAPGTGKTSLGKSIARSLGRAYFRISLGGIKDEAEIRGHRRTYVGAMPGRFIQGLRKAGTLNPVIIIDELDKIGSDFRGDPSAAMLEILDPHQNTAFYDNYLGIPFDLSKTIFIATANSIETLSAPLRDRMEIIPISGYTHEEKLAIAKTHIIRRAQEESGLKDHNINLSDDILSQLINNYTRESGVRQLERVIKKLYSKGARYFVEKKKSPEFTNKNIENYLGPRLYASDECNTSNTVGICNGLAWTSYGGEIVKIEAVLMPGSGKLILTGQLGDVMKESAQAALSYARSHAKEFGIDQKMFTKNDVHIHVPAGAVPKDGPSAGITMLSAILSVLTDCPINSQYAMTGEINLQGEVMPIGGVKEKILAAKRNGLIHVILPFKNKHELVGLEDIAKDIDIIWVQKAEEVLSKVLIKPVKKAPVIA